jgi:hypothetical protein
LDTWLGARTGTMSADVPRPFRFTFGRGSPPHGESLVYPTTSHLHPDKERLIHDWLDADGEGTPARLDNIETTGPLPENTEENPVRTSEDEDLIDLFNTPEQLSTNTKPPGTSSTALTTRTAEKSVVQKSKQYGWRWEWDPTARDFIHVGKSFLSHALRYWQNMDADMCQKTGKRYSTRSTRERVT